MRKSGGYWIKYNGEFGYVAEYDATKDKWYLYGNIQTRFPKGTECVPDEILHDEPLTPIRIK